MKKSLNIQINFTNRAIYTLITFSIFLLIGISVFAFGTSDPPTFGHSAGELDLSGGVQGDAVFLGSIKIGTSTICDTNTEGSLRYNSVDKKIEYCNGTGWNAVGSLCGDTVTDGDGKSYNTVLIGTQCWMATNLEYPSSGGCRDVTWANNTDVGWCGYYDGIDYGDEGLLYEWSAVMNGTADCNGIGESQPSCSTPVQGLCPAGWHIPSHYEFTALEREVCDSATCVTDFPYDESTAYYVQGTDEGDQLRTVADCFAPSTSDCGSSNFNALLTGMISYGTGKSDNRGTYTRLWSSSVKSSNGYKWNRYLHSNDVVSGFAGIYPAANPGYYGWSVRCIKD